MSIDEFNEYMRMSAVASRQITVLPVLDEAVYRAVVLLRPKFETVYYLANRLGLTRVYEPMSDFWACFSMDQDHRCFYSGSLDFRAESVKSST